jgi:hypothetical protein
MLRRGLSDNIAGALETLRRIGLKFAIAVFLFHHHGGNTL